MMYRIAYGSIRTTFPGKNRLSNLTMWSYREGWWWTVDRPSNYGLYDAEGPFKTKNAAKRHLIALRSGHERRFSGWAMENASRKSKLKPIYKLLTKRNQESRAMSNVIVF